MELLQLKYFKTVARTGKISAAAQELYLSAPALSTSIARLEKELGMPLFDRTGNRVTLNAQGVLFARYVDRVFDTLSEAENELHRSFLRQQHHIWVMTTNSQLWVNLIAAVTQTYPHFILSCTNMNLSKLTMGAALSQYTFLLAEDGEIPEAYADDLESALLFEDQPAVLLPPDHPLAGCEQVTAKMLGEETLFLPMQGMATRDRFIRLLENGGVDPTGATSCSSVLYHNMVRQGMGIAFTTVKASPMEPQDLKCVPLQNTLAPWRMRLFWHRDRPLTEDECIFREFVKDFYKNSPA